MHFPFFRLVLLLASLLATPWARAAYDSNLGGVSSDYTLPVLSLLREHVARQAPRTPDEWNELTPENPLRLQAWTHTTKEKYTGVERLMRVRQPLVVVRAVLEGIDRYGEFFAGFKSIKVVERYGSQLRSDWEQSVPFPFRNVKFAMLSLFDAPRPEIFTAHYQLAQRTSVMKAYDGAIVLIARGTETEFRGWEFVDAERGLLGLSTEGVWRRALESTYRSDVGLLLRAEDAKLSKNDVEKKANALLAAHPVENLVKSRQPYYKATAPRD